MFPRQGKMDPRKFETPQYSNYGGAFINLDVQDSDDLDETVHIGARKPGSLTKSNARTKRKSN